MGFPSEIYSLIVICCALWAILWVWLFWKRKSQFSMQQGAVIFTGFIAIPAILRAAYSPGRIPYLDWIFADFGPLAFFLTALLLTTVLVMVVIKTVK
jgi:hypothetical protein